MFSTFKMVEGAFYRAVKLQKMVESLFSHRMDTYFH